MEPNHQNNDNPLNQEELLNEIIANIAEVATIIDDVITSLWEDLFHEMASTNADLDADLMAYVSNLFNHIQTVLNDGNFIPNPALADEDLLAIEEGNPTIQDDQSTSDTENPPNIDEEIPSTQEDQSTSETENPPIVDEVNPSTQEDQSTTESKDPPTVNEDDPSIPEDQLTTDDSSSTMSEELESFEDFVGNIENLPND